eukprot:TRINITY_DN31633_c0_g2_i1.p1 TRINITY_DN31633_c0_g2~~TRINITY_DN31633_c0_g2_i1.p1  ORF type:complete len:507 (+),score=84.50 TRINITY_DN31633_c0_g2_i1:55-1575(+)
MLDIKELFTPDRRRMLHGGGLPAPTPSRLQCYAAEASQALDVPAENWQRFPDPAGNSVLQSRALRINELLAAGGTALQHCYRDAQCNRNLLRHCRSQLEEHQASTAAVRDLLAGSSLISHWNEEEKENCWAAENAAIAAGRPLPQKAASRARCIGRARCFFCRERSNLEEQLGAASSTRAGEMWELESAVLADASDSCESPLTPKGFATWGRPAADLEEEKDVISPASPARKKVQLRRTPRERGGCVYRPRMPALQKVPSTNTTWYDKHTVDPSARGSLELPQANTKALDSDGSMPTPQPVLAEVQATPMFREASPPLTAAICAEESQRTKPQAEAESATSVKLNASAPSAPSGEVEGAANAAELEPYTSAAARFRAEMEFLFSFPASPDAGPGGSEVLSPHTPGSLRQTRRSLFNWAVEPQSQEAIAIEQTMPNLSTHVASRQTGVLLRHVRVQREVLAVFHWQGLLMRLSNRAPSSDRRTLLVFMRGSRWEMPTPTILGDSSGF